MMKLVKFLLPLTAAALLFTSCDGIEGIGINAEETGVNTVANYNVWTDAANQPIQAHDSIIKVGSKYYWYGMDYGYQNDHDFNAINCYESTDLVNWKLKNHVLTKNSSAALNGCSVNSANVVYNRKTGMYVMWLGYNNWRVIVAVCDKPYGNFKIVNSDFGINDGAVISSLFIDDDNQGYVITYAKDDGDDTYKTFIYDMSDDYTQITTAKHSWGIASMAWPKMHTGRASIVKYEGMYYLIEAVLSPLYEGNNSGSSKPSYDPWWLDYKNSRYLGVYYAKASSIGELSKSGLEPFGPSYRGQEFSSVISVRGSEETNYILAFNKWDVNDLSNSGYVWQKLEFEPDTTATEGTKVYKPAFTAFNYLDIDAKNGTVEGHN